MIDHNGEQWEPARTASKLTGIREDTIHQWVRRGKVRSHKVGRNRWVNIPDIRHAEAEWHRRLQRDAGVV